MRRTARLVVLATAAISLLAAIASTAGAVTWTNTGSTTVHATGGPGTLSIGPNNMSCQSSTATGTAPADLTGVLYSMSGTITFTNCTLLPGQSTYIHCGFTFTGSSWIAGTPARTTGVANVTCVLRLTAPDTPLCHIEGTTPLQYFNPSGTAPGKVTLSTSGTGLSVTHATGTSCLLGTGAGHLSEQTITVTSVAGSPVITRQA